MFASSEIEAEIARNSSSNSCAETESGHFFSSGHFGHSLFPAERRFSHFTKSTLKSRRSNMQCWISLAAKACTTRHRKMAQEYMALCKARLQKRFKSNQFSLSSLVLHCVSY